MGHSAVAGNDGRTEEEGNAEGQQRRGLWSKLVHSLNSSRGREGRGGGVNNTLTSDSVSRNGLTIDPVGPGRGGMVAG